MGIISLCHNFHGSPCPEGLTICNTVQVWGNPFLSLFLEENMWLCQLLKSTLDSTVPLECLRCFMHFCLFVPFATTLQGRPCSKRRSKEANGEARASPGVKDVNRPLPWGSSSVHQSCAEFAHVLIRCRFGLLRIGLALNRLTACRSLLTAE